ncbi:unnamed protein product [Musa hybrid cultivar]
MPLGTENVDASRTITLELQGLGAQGLLEARESGMPFATAAAPRLPRGGGNLTSVPVTSTAPPLAVPSQMKLLQGRRTAPMADLSMDTSLVVAHKRILVFLDVCHRQLRALQLQLVRH